MRKLFAALSVVALSASSFAALPPYADSVRKIATVLSSPELGETIYGEINAVVAAEEDLTYMVRTTYCVARVVLDAHSPRHPGPTSYSVGQITDIACEGRD